MDGRRESIDGRRGGGDGLDDRGRCDVDDDPIPLEGLATRTLLTVGERARVGVEGLEARGAIEEECARGDIGRGAPGVSWGWGGAIRTLARVDGVVEGLARDADEETAGTGTGTDFEDLCLVPGFGFWLGSSFAENVGLYTSLAVGCRLIRRVRERVGETKPSVLEEEEALTVD